MKATAFVLFAIVPLVASAGEYRYKEALEQAKLQAVKLPEMEEDGRIRTLNKKGSMFQPKDMASEGFLNSLQGKAVLEIGAAFGNVLLESLNLGFENYTANDLDPR